MITGNIAQIETMGLVDGPGIRVVVFMQGCPLRCIYCHNPEMWSLEGGTKQTPQGLLKAVLKYKNYFGETGGITFSGGEPLTQPAFLYECLKLCKKVDLNTCLDTSGVGDSLLIPKILSKVDLVIFDIKALTNDKYKDITNSSTDKSLDFLKLCQKLNKRLWLRTVIIPDINDNDEYINDLAAFIKPLKNIEKVELLPFHTMGNAKYKAKKIKNQLNNKDAMDIKKCNELQNKLNKLLNI